MMNNDLISRSALLDLFDAKAFDALELFDGGMTRKTWLEAFETVKNAPAVDAEPVQHGRWIPIYEEVERLTTEGWQMEEAQTVWKCSECGREEVIGRDSMPYCHCGAKMDAEVEG